MTVRMPWNTRATIPAARVFMGYPFFMLLGHGATQAFWLECGSPIAERAGGLSSAERCGVSAGSRLLIGAKSPYHSLIWKILRMRLARLDGTGIT
jgi:hypothetical protein